MQTTLPRRSKLPDRMIKKNKIRNHKPKNLLNKLSKKRGRKSQWPPRK
jgi:hypothetical protein